MQSPLEDRKPPGPTAALGDGHSHEKEIQRRRREIRAANRPEAEMDVLFREELAHEKSLLGVGPYAAKVGAFEGAGYTSKGLYRPALDCIMFSKGTKPFCRVCARAIGRVIEYYDE